MRRTCMVHPTAQNIASPIGLCQELGYRIEKFTEKLILYSDQQSVSLPINYANWSLNTSSICKSGIEVKDI